MSNISQHSPLTKHDPPLIQPMARVRASPRVLHHGGALGVQNHQPRSLGDAVRREELHDDFLGIPGRAARGTGDG